MNTDELLTPSTAQRTSIHSTAELSCGDHIEAAYQGAVIHRGHVTRITAGNELFWITDHLNGNPPPAGRDRVPNNPPLALATD